MRSRFIAALGLVILLLAMTARYAMAAEPDWKIVFGPHARLDDIDYGNGVYVATGDAIIMASADGVKWTPGEMAAS